MEYIATFYSHFGAVRFRKIREKNGDRAKLMPVPRKLSSSCGTCVSFQSDDPAWRTDPRSMLGTDRAAEEVEQVVAVNEDGYEPLYSAES